MLDSLSLSLNDGLDLFNYVLVDMLSNNRSVDTGRVSLIADRLLMRVLSLLTVSDGNILGDVLGDVTSDMRSSVLMVCVELLAVSTMYKSASE